MKNFLIKYNLLPRYRDLDFFLITVMIFLFALTDSYVWDSIVEIKDMPFKLQFFSLVIIFTAFLSVFNIIFERKMTYDKFFLLAYAVLADVLVGLSAGSYVLEQSKGILVIFPILNIVYAILLIILWRSDFLDDDSISTKQSDLPEIFLGTFSVMLLFFVLHFLFQSYWAITFSICLFYSNFINNMFFRFIKKQFEG
jgi:hypothetical protein